MEQLLLSLPNLLEIKGSSKKVFPVLWLTKKRLRSSVNQKVKQLFESQGTLAPVKKITMAAGRKLCRNLKGKGDMHQK